MRDASPASCVACDACAVSVRVLVVALVLQLLLAGAFALWAASGFPLP